MTINKEKIKRILIGLVWMLVAAGSLTLLVSGVRSRDAARCSGVEIDITGVSNNFFIDKNDVYTIIKNFGGDSTGRHAIASVDLLRIEKALEKDLWVKHAELFFDNNNVLKVLVEEREPVVRIFTVGGNTFYTDSSAMRLPLSEKFSARLPVFTGFPSDATSLSATDSSLLADVKNLSIKIARDSFLMAMIDQVSITPARTFEMTPKIGRQTIIFGNAADADAKLAKLKLFYKEVIPDAGWNRYQTINLVYRGQIVASIRGQAEITADSLQTLARLKMIETEAAKRAADSSQHVLPETDKTAADSALLHQSVQHDAEGETTAITHEAAASPAVVTPKPQTLQTGAPPIKPSPKAAPKPKSKPAAAKPGNEY